MTPERWQQIESVYHQALARPAAERAAFVADACAGDADLQREVVSLLNNSGRSSDSFLDVPAAIAAEVAGHAHRSPQVVVGQRLGVYQILDRIGAGGMGVVFRARDTKLGREVAIKLLSPDITHEPARLARFEREARVLATLNHPNIGAIYGLEAHDGIPALILEFVPGETLAARIARGPLPLSEALAVARQIADALDAAHECGIVHRDLKPANVLVKPDGTVKVLDFGLAKTMDPAGSSADLANSPTRTTHPVSVSGVILGTAAYMSPEQAAGRPIDKRSDIWAFGVVLFEMLAGRPVFTGETVSHVIAAVLREEPAWSALPAETPPSIRRLLRHCLEKDHRRRLDSAAAVRLELEDALTPSVIEAQLQPPRTRGTTARVVMTSLLAGAAVAGLAAWALMRPAPPAPAPVARFVITPPSDLPLQLSTQAAARDFAVARDGSFLVYVAGAERKLVVRRFDHLDGAPLPGVSDATMPFISPDGRSIGYVDDNLTLRKVPVDGGTPVTLAQLPVWPRGATWLDEATIVVGTNSTTSGLLRVPAGGGDATVLTTPDRSRGEEGHILPSGLPGGRYVLFTIGAARPQDSQIAVLDLQTGQHTTVLRGGRDAQYLPSGHLVFLADRALSAVRFDLSSRVTVGDPVRVMDGLALAPTTALNVAVTEQGTLVYVPGGLASAPQRTLAWVDRQGRETPLPAPERPYDSARISPDGSRVAVSIRDQDNDIWIWTLARQTLTRLTFDPDFDITPVWSADGRRVLFASARTGAYNVYSRDVDGVAQDTRLTSSANTQLPDSVTLDGTAIVGHEVQPLTRSGIVRFVPAPGGGDVPDVADSLVDSPFDEWNPDVSPDGRFLAYQSVEAGVGQSEIYVRPYPKVDDARWQVSSGGGSEPAWTRDGRELIFLDAAHRLTAVPVHAAGSGLVVGSPSTLSSTAYAGRGTWRSYDVSPDGQRFLVMKDVATDSQEPAHPGFVVVQNWFEELSRLLPSR